MAFQLVDDLLDFTGEEDALGKPVGGDLREGKMTLPVIHLLASHDARAELLIRKIVNERNASVDEWHELRNLLAQHRSIEYTRRVATDFVQRAKDALQIFPASAERDALMYLPDYVLSRDR
jgi:octaprenyl-diphosphate synthase